MALQKTEADRENLVKQIILGLLEDGEAWWQADIYEAVAEMNGVLITPEFPLKTLKIVVYRLIEEMTKGRTTSRLRFTPHKMIRSIYEGSHIDTRVEALMLDYIYQRNDEGVTRESLVRVSSIDGDEFEAWMTYLRLRKEGELTLRDGKWVHLAA